MRARFSARLHALAWMLGIALLSGCGDSNDGSGNRSPLAVAGADREVPAGTVVALDGSLSSDPDGDPIAYAWTLASRPAGSEAALSDPQAPQPSFIADRVGEYGLELIVSDGSMPSAPDTVVITATRSNARPVASAGADETVALGSVVTIDGSASTDPDGDALTYLWTLAAKPEGSGAGVKDVTAARTVFVADVVGEFRLQLVVADGEATSEPDEVVFTVVDTNVPPIAAAGADRTVAVGSVVDIDGRKSSDPDGDAITHVWSFVSKPTGSNAGIKDSAKPKTLFVADAEGQFVIQLVVDDGRAQSAPDVLVITATRSNAAPVAVAGADQSVQVGDPVTLDGAESNDPDGTALGFAWSFVSRPEGSAAALDAPTAARTGFVADVAGQYVVQLLVTDGQIESRADTVVVTATAEGEGGGGGGGSDGCADPGSTILCDSLNGSTRGSAKGGQFVSGGGWQPGWNIVWDLGRTLSEGAFSAELSNWDTSTSSPQHQHSKQHILNMFQEGHGSVHTADENGTGFWNVRTGRDYNDLFKFLSSTRGFDERLETRLSPPGGRLDPRVTHTVRVEFDRAGNATVFLDGRSLVTQPHPRSFALRYVLVGTDNSPGDTYGPQAGVIYSNIKVWGSTTGGRMVAANLSTVNGEPVVEELPVPRIGQTLVSWLRGAGSPLGVVSLPALR